MMTYFSRKKTYPYKTANGNRTMQSQKSALIAILKLLLVASLLILGYCAYTVSQKTRHQTLARNFTKY